MKVTLTEIISKIRNLDESKAAQSNDIPTKVIKENYDIFDTFINENLINNLIENSQIHLNKQILSQYTRQIPEMKRKPAGL